MRRKLCGLFTFQVLLLLGFAPMAGAVTIKNLEFNVDGVLPSSEPDIGFFIDDVLQLATVLQNIVTGLNGFNFGDSGNASGNTAGASWDWIRVSQTTVVPEPSMGALLGMGLVAMRRRRRLDG